MQITPESGSVFGENQHVYEVKAGENPYEHEIALIDDLKPGDVDGVVVIPGAIADDAIALALTKVAAENRTRDALLRGELLQDVYARFGVL